MHFMLFFFAITIYAEELFNYVGGTVRVVAEPPPLLWPS